MKKFYTLGFLLFTIISISQINSPNGNNIFYYNGLADVIFKFPERGSGGRAMVHDTWNVLSLNYGGDFTGGTRIGTDVFFKDGGNSFIYSGNFGIGTNNPLAKFEINRGDILVKNLINVDNSSAIMIGHSIVDGNLTTFGTSIRTITQNGGANVYGMQFFTQESHVTNQTEKVRIQGNGNVGIGTINPQNKLDVNGTIHSKEVKVDMTGWSDFVFKKNYNLPTLEEVEKHIAEKGHLENIPNEKEVLKNGINLGEMNSKLLQKIEEMTLYIIEQNKINNKQLDQISNLKDQVDSLKKQNEALDLILERLSQLEQRLN
ncbi:hypothetical protein [Flavobacterium sp. DG2-3]|uniref:hypothetical protein n=1 Tax=Flavobacterium sp. DG2-3 TaxID=3068317 RepID=UPI00273FD833|nr:hypothetical protein [Flavobacterium sp. DG2-3]MDP5202025.1 hypothetical protein [Flavobacterium sp. DG2-3]